MIYKSLIQDFFYEDSGSTALSYYLTCGGETIYTGRAYNPKGIKINIRKLVEDWLWNTMPDFRAFDGVVFQHDTAIGQFNLYTDEGTLLEEYKVLLSYEPWSGEDMHLNEPIDNKADPRQKFFVSSVESTGTTFDLIGWERLRITFDEALVLPASGGSHSIGYEANTGITLSEDCGWYSVSKTVVSAGTNYEKGTLDFSFNDNTSDNTRECTMYVTQEDYVGAVCTQPGVTLPFPVMQLSGGGYFSIGNGSIGRLGGEVTLYYTTNYTDEELLFVPSSGVTIISINNGVLVVDVPINEEHATKYYNINVYKVSNGALVGTSTITQAAKYMATRADYLTVEALEEGSLVRLNHEQSHTIWYNKNDEGWHAATAHTICDVSRGDMVKLAGSSNDRLFKIGIEKDGDINYHSGRYCLYGNLVSLFKPVNSDFSGVTQFPVNYIGEVSKGELFASSNVVDASELKLVCDCLDSYCYESMFEDCRALVRPPELPATRLADNCYRLMFSGCISLTEAPELPAMDLKNNSSYAVGEPSALGCYRGMFENCTSLIKAPELPATAISPYCYYGMFSGCTSLVEAPSVLPGIYCDYDSQGYEVADSSYAYMFDGCTSLVTPPSEIALSPKCSLMYTYDYMFRNCTSLTAAPRFTSTETGGIYAEGMFEGCTSLVTGPQLPVNSRNNMCKRMFFGCTSLVTPPSVLKQNTISKDIYSSMFEGCTSLVSGTSIEVLFAGSGSLGVNQCSRMYYGCSNLKYIKILATDVSANGCLYNWTYGVPNNGTFVKKRNVSYPSGASGIPNGWTVQEIA